MSNTDDVGQSLKGPVDNVVYGTDDNFDESEELLPNNERSDNPNEGRLLKYADLMFLIVVLYGFIFLRSVPFNLLIH